MPFRALFIIASADLYLHGPAVDDKEKMAAALASILAVFINAQLAFVLAELVWFAVFFRAWQNSPAAGAVQQNVAASSAAAVTTTTTVAEVKPIGVPEMPAQLRQALDASLAEFVKGCGPNASDGTPWTLVSKEGNLSVSNAPYPGQSFLRWKVEIDGIWGPLDGIYDELFNYSKRCGPNGWDKSVAGGRIVKQFADGYRVVIYSTAPALGGLVTGREFVDGRVVRYPPEGGLVLSGLGLEEKVWKPVLGADYPQGDSSLTRARAFPGGGFLLSPIGAPPPDRTTPALWKFTLVSAVLLGGWLPQSSINSATSQVLVESSKLTFEHLKSKFPKP